MNKAIVYVPLLLLLFTLSSSIPFVVVTSKTSAFVDVTPPNLFSSSDILSDLVVNAGMSDKANCCVICSN